MKSAVGMRPLIVLLLPLIVLGAKFDEIEIDGADMFHTKTGVEITAGHAAPWIHEVQTPDFEHSNYNWKHFQKRDMRMDVQRKNKILSIFPCERMNGNYRIRVADWSKKYLTDIQIYMTKCVRVTKGREKDQWRIYATESRNDVNPILIQNKVIFRNGRFNPNEGAMLVMTNERYRNYDDVRAPAYAAQVSTSFNRAFFTEWVPWCDPKNRVYLQIYGTNKWLHSVSLFSSKLTVEDTIHPSTAFYFESIADEDTLSVKKNNFNS